MPEARSLIDVKEAPSFLDDEREIKAALIHVREFARPDAIRNWDEAGAAADAIKELRAVISAAEAHRKETNAPYEASKAHVNAHYKELLAQPEAAVAKLKERVAAFKEAEAEAEQERRRQVQERLDRDAEERAAEAQAAAERAAQDSSPEAKQAAADAHAAAAKAATATAAPIAPPKQVRGALGAIGTRTEYRFEVVDAMKLPAEYLAPNEKAIKAAVKGERAMAKAQERSFNLSLIPGVRITPQEVPVSR